MAGPCFAASDDAAPSEWDLEDREAAEALRRLVAASVQEVPAGTALELASDETAAVHFVLSGWLIASKSTLEGHRQIIDFVLPREVFDPGSADPERSAIDLSTLTEVRLSTVPRGDWERLLQTHASLREVHDRRLAAGFARLAERMLRLGKGDAETRIAYAVCELWLRAGAGRRSDAARDFHVPLTQQVLGDFAGLSSVHVSRTFARLAEAGIVSSGAHMHVVIHDVARLAETAGIDLADLRAEIIPER